MSVLMRESPEGRNKEMSLVMLVLMIGGVVVAGTTYLVIYLQESLRKRREGWVVYSDAVAERPTEVNLGIDPMDDRMEKDDTAEEPWWERMMKKFTNTEKMFGLFEWEDGEDEWEDEELGIEPMADDWEEKEREDWEEEKLDDWVEVDMEKQGSAVQTITIKYADGFSSNLDTSTRNRKKCLKVEATTDEKFVQEALKAHNEYREKHGSSPLELNRDLCKVAQAWVNKLAAQDTTEVSTSEYGENVFWGYGDDVKKGSYPVDYWYSEVKDFDFQKGDYVKGTGHFTQVVWKGSKELGVAKAVSKTGVAYVVATYEPAGNYVGEFTKNVGQQ